MIDPTPKELAEKMVDTRNHRWSVRGSPKYCDVTFNDAVIAKMELGDGMALVRILRRELERFIEDERRANAESRTA